MPGQSTANRAAEVENVLAALSSMSSMHQPATDGVV
jgi:hypothetical protein